MKNTPGPIEGLAYDSAMIAFRTATNKKVRSRQNLKDFLLENMCFEWVTRKTSLKSNWESWKKLYLLQKNGPNFVNLNKWQFEEFLAQYQFNLIIPRSLLRGNCCDNQNAWAMER